MIPKVHELHDRFGGLFKDLTEYYDHHFNLDPNQIITYEEVLESSVILPISGNVFLPKYCVYLSQLPIVDRLSGIKQLAHTFILFPGAMHTRYEHSLGVLNISRNVLLKVKDISGGTEIADEKIILEIAALLHDIGHPSWGHALDGVAGYLVQLIKEAGEFPLKPLSLNGILPEKLDITIAFYLLLKNFQLSKALEVCARELKDKDMQKFFKELLVQIISEELTPLFPFNKKLLHKAYLLTTIIGEYKTESNSIGINADRLDWLPRDVHHGNLIKKLGPEYKDTYDKFIKYLNSGSFSIEIKDDKFVFISDRKFKSLIEDLRNGIYAFIYEGKERAFIDSLLTRLVYSTVKVLHITGNKIRSPQDTLKAIIGYMMMPDYELLEYTRRILGLAYENSELLEKADPLKYGCISEYISGSYELVYVLINYIKYILHSLMSSNVIETSLHKFGHLIYLNVDAIRRTTILITGENLRSIIEALPSHINFAEFIANIIEGGRADPISILRIPIIEKRIRADFGNSPIFLLINYYFFRKLKEIVEKRKPTSLEELHTLITESLGSYPLMFILIKSTDYETMKRIFEKVCDNIYAELLSYKEKYMFGNF
jgi:hypothetical protein